MWSLLPVGTFVENQLVVDKTMISTKVPNPSFQQSILGQLGINMQNNEVGPLSHNIYKNDLKMDQDLNVRAIKRKHRCTFLRPVVWQ